MFFLVMLLLNAYSNKIGIITSFQSAVYATLCYVLPPQALIVQYLVFIVLLIWECSW